MAALLRLLLLGRVAAAFEPSHAPKTRLGFEPCLAKACAEVVSLPGYDGELPTRQYSGYVAVNGSRRFLHYYYVEAMHSPATAPLIAWTNGGPGCSSMAGMLTEMGWPHVTTHDSFKLERNPMTWSLFANMLYVEHPAWIGDIGVGFSYALDDYVPDDDSDGRDNAEFMRGFLTIFPELQGRETYLVGESYAGIYVPTWASYVLDANDAGLVPAVNLRGIAVGNGCAGLESPSCGTPPSKTFDESTWGGYVDFFEGRSFISPTRAAEIRSECNALYATSLIGAGLDGQCDGAFREGADSPFYACCVMVDDAINGNATGDLYIYDVQAKCPRYPNDDAISGPSLRFKAPVAEAMRKHADGLAVCASLGGLEPPVSWLRQPAVMAAMHVNPAIEWSECANIPYNSTAVNLPRDVYPKLLARIKVLVFSGDADGCVPTFGSARWTKELAESLGLAPTASWAPWAVDRQVAGYVTTWANPDGHAYSFATIKDAGHMVPQFQPKRALALLARFVFDVKIDSPSIPQVVLASSPPPHLSAHAGVGVTLAVEAKSSDESKAGGMFTYEWLLNGSPVENAVEATLTVDASHAGDYVCVVTSILGASKTTPSTKVSTLSRGKSPGHLVGYDTALALAVCLTFFGTILAASVALWFYTKKGRSRTATIDSYSLMT
ncbi:serine carboxypeptidase-domain-containing protein [Pelagophyceae sp. CCMP2097]|nr:serine carboxypeptidase-domain-containing protein [Pelagophyceae sp. CCMP2097]|mmetsp:Transcript_7605/g.26627  ORF Transcript_7605/g.26627 Transcript_7605/m.26627 type:complete len:665 (+) Transcript_7605:45-2039(+)